MCRYEIGDQALENVENISRNWKNGKAQWGYLLALKRDIKYYRGL
jgi:hypothetical protein